MRLNQVTVGTHDVERAIAFYRALGLELIVRSAHYARFACPDGGSTFSVHLTDAAIVAGTVVYFECDDLDATAARLRSSGLAFDGPPTDRPWLWREALLDDPDGNRVCLYFAGRNRLDPPWRIREATSVARP